MGSLSKIKPDTGFLEPWLTKFKGPYVISDKLDGVSAQIYNDPKLGIKMYTRGEMTDEGNIGQDITDLLKYIDCGGIKNIERQKARRFMRLLGASLYLIP